jgi:CheY-like chemotaxis protein
MESVKKRILLVEDHADTRAMMAISLRKKGYEVDTAKSIAEALELCEHEDFDLLLGDILLPDGSGLDLLPKARRRLRIKGIAITGCGFADDIENSRVAGYSAHLTKPVEPELLFQTIEDILDETTL